MHSFPLSRSLLSSRLLAPRLLGPLLRLPFFCGALVFGVALQAHAYQLDDDIWDVAKGPVEFNPEPTGSEDVTDGSDVEAVRQAIAIWGCVDASALRTRVGAEPGVKVVSFDDGKNSIFWTEEALFGVDFENPDNPDQPYPLAVIARGLADQTILRDAGDIILNGIDYTWSTDQTPNTLDVMGVVLPAIGSVLGLKTSDVAGVVMSATGGTLHELQPDDMEGLAALYPNATNSTCEGPLQTGEFCACNADCVEGLICDVSTTGDSVCVPTCSSDDNACPAGFACVLSARIGDAPAKGRCQLFEDGDGRPVASTCERDGDCAAGVCLSSSVIGRTICRKSCEAATDCGAGYGCVDNICVADGGGEGNVCSEPALTPTPDEGCRCVASGMGLGGSATGNSGGPTGLLLGLLLLPGFAFSRQKRPGENDEKQHR